MQFRLCLATLSPSESRGSQPYLLSESFSFSSSAATTKSVVYTQICKSYSSSLCPGTEACPVDRSIFFFDRRKIRHRYRKLVKSANFPHLAEYSVPGNVSYSISNADSSDHSELPSGRVNNPLSNLGNNEIDTGGDFQLFRITLRKDSNDGDDFSRKLLQKVLQGGSLIILAIGMWFTISRGVQSTGRNPRLESGAVIRPCSAATFHSTALEMVSESQSWYEKSWAEDMDTDNLLIITKNWDDHGENTIFKCRKLGLKPEGNSHGIIYDLETSKVQENDSIGYLTDRDVDLVKMTTESMAKEWPKENNLYMTEADAAGVVHELEEEEDKELEKKSQKPWRLTVPLRIVSLRGSVPPLWLRDFITSQGRHAKVTMKVHGDLGAIVSQLSCSLKEKKLTQESTMASDLVTIGDLWLEHAISRGVLSPLKGSESSEWFQNLNPAWQAHLRRDEKGQLSHQGSIYAAPYRLGATVIAFRHDLFTKHNIPPIKKWEDLWHPRLVGRVAMVNSPREVVGATLKSLGAPYNVDSFEKDVKGGRKAVAERFKTLRKQVRLFDSTNHLKALKAGDVYVAVGWSNDVLSFARRSSQVTVVTPEDGTSLWADLWAVPATNKVRSNKIGGRIRGPSPLVSQWINFCLQPARAQSFQQEIFIGASPIEIPPSFNLGIRTAGSTSAVTQKSPSEKQIAWNEAFRGSLELKPSGSLQEGTSKGSEEVSDEKNLGVKGRFLGGGLSSLEVLSKSELLQPLSISAVDDYKWLLALESREGGSSLYYKLRNFFKVKGNL